ncbi:MAG: hypothetical protein JXR07_06960 [Reichenbachiella sp.]
MMITSLFIHAQKLEGRYVLNNGLSHKTIIFNNDRNFNLIEKVVTNHDELHSKGYYLISGDSIILCFDKFKSARNSLFSIKQKTDTIATGFGSTTKIQNDVISMDLTIYNLNKDPISGASIVCMNGSSILFGKLSNNVGKTKIYSEGQFLDFITISHLGYNSLKIPTEDFWGFHSSLEVFLSEENGIIYNFKNKIEKFIILKNSKEELQLFSFEKDESFIYKKMP